MNCLMSCGWHSMAYVTHRPYLWTFSGVANVHGRLWLLFIKRFYRLTPSSSFLGCTKGASKSALFDALTLTFVVPGTKHLVNSNRPNLSPQRQKPITPNDLTQTQEAALSALHALNWLKTSDMGIDMAAYRAKVIVNIWVCYWLDKKKFDS